MKKILILFLLTILLSTSNFLGQNIFQVENKTADQNKAFHLTGKDGQQMTVEGYCEFLNEVATSDPLHLYDEKMATDLSTACIVRMGGPGHYTYEVIPRRNDALLSFVSWDTVSEYCKWTGHSEQLVQQSEDGEGMMENIDPSLKANILHVGLITAVSLSEESSAPAFRSALEEKITGGIFVLGLLLIGREMSRSGEESSSSTSESLSSETRRPNASLQQIAPFSSDKSMEVIHTMRDGLAPYPLEGERISSDSKEPASNKNLVSINNDEHHLPMLEKRMPSLFIKRPSENQSAAVLTSHKIDQVNRSTKASQDTSTTLSVPVEKTFSNQAERIKILNKAATCAKAVVQFAADAEQATISIYNVLQLVIDGRRDDKRTEPISIAAGCGEIATEAIEGSLKNIEGHLVSLKSLEAEPAQPEPVSTDEMLLVELNLAITALKEATEQLYSASEAAMDDTRYHGERADQALAPIKALYKNHDALFKEADAITRLLPIKAPAFPSFAAKKEALRQLLQDAEKATAYATDLMDGPATQFCNILETYHDNDAAEEHLSQLVEADRAVQAASAISAIAIRNATHHLHQWETLTDENTLAATSDEAFVFASLELVPPTLEKAAKNLAAAIEPVEEYKSTWWHAENVENTLTSLQTIKEAYEFYKNSSRSLEAVK